jgi:hypothetical protein
MSRGLPVLVYTMQHDLPWILLVTQTQIGKEITLITSPLQDMSSTLDQDLSVGQVRRNQQFLYHQQRKSTWVQ